MRILLLALIILPFGSYSQDVVPKAKTKEQRKAERKQMSLEEKIESTLPVEISGTPSLDEARKTVGQVIPTKKGKEKKRTFALKEKKKEVKTFDGKSYKGIAVEKELLTDDLPIRNSMY